MVIDETCDTRGDIAGRKRSDVYREVTDLSVQSFEMYARWIGADHLYSDQPYFTDLGKVDRNNPLSHVCVLYDVLRIIYDPLFDEYDKVLFVDTDIIVNTKKSIFDVSDADVAGVYESNIITGKGGGYNSWDYATDKLQMITRKHDKFDVPVIPALPPLHPSKVSIMNTGVMVWQRDARLEAREKFLDWREWCAEGVDNGDHPWVNNDQVFLSGQMHQYLDVECIDQTWNDSPPHYETEEEGLKSNFLHYTGGDYKMIMLEQAERGYFPIFNGSLGK